MVIFVLFATLFEDRYYTGNLLYLRKYTLLQRLVKQKMKGRAKKRGTIFENPPSGPDAFPVFNEFSSLSSCPLASKRSSIGETLSFLPSVLAGRAGYCVRFRVEQKAKCSFNTVAFSKSSVMNDPSLSKVENVSLFFWP